MPMYRFTMMVSSNFTQPSVGFSESWTANAANDTKSRERMQTLIDERTKILSESWTITSGRIGKLAITGSGPTAKIVERLVQPLQCNSGLPGKLGPSDTPWAAVLIELNKVALADTTVRTRPREQQLRGIPDGWWVDGALAIPEADKGKVQSFFSWLINPTTFGAGQARIVSSALFLQNFLAPCFKRISNRRIGRPFGLIRGRKWARRETA